MPVSRPVRTIQGMRTATLPGADLIEQGMKDLAAGTETAESLLVSIGSPRLRALGWSIPTVVADAELRLYALLSERHGDGAHSRYNALIRQLVSFTRAAACAK